MEGSPPTITLRPFNLSDLDDFMVWASDDRVTQFCSWDTFTSKDTLLDYIKEKVLPHPWLRAICVGGRPVGTILVSPTANGGWQKAEIGYHLASGEWGKGIATAAVRAAMGVVFGEMEGLERLQALVDVENPASQRVLEKAGFKREGVLRKYVVMKGKSRDMVIFSFLSTDPMQL